mmetsp:Transcript_18428/g.50582  ORF Transcript_18428/g.50582 Transcript_18428/m.50582 type:complete len:586 (+) Transcript_18428:42-1799(+)|eukprot:CAMPEP_0117520400 /NCGR_PEP_ID=MMETSP0784-20121206/33149_1 /TAXON_ID=39447 /ORGANISM="" /LENGTH=585 /DNA_ID=CAMNT_0005316393 /DNA_START=42 /DNA_END=1799 /DNA_ORIENTATION=-
MGCGASTSTASGSSTKPEATTTASGPSTKPEARTPDPDGDRFRRAHIFAQMSPKQFFSVPCDEWARFNKELSSQRYELVVYLSNPGLFRLLTVDRDDDIDQQVLVTEHKESMTRGFADNGGTSADAALSNVSLFTTFDLHSLVKDLGAACQEEEERDLIMSSISNSSYDVPKVLDFLLRVCFPAVPTVRFDSDVVIDFDKGTIDLAVLGVVQRATHLFEKLSSESSNQYFAFSSRYNEVHQATQQQWCKQYSTRPNPALNVSALLSEYATATGNLPEAEALPDAESLHALAEAAKSLESSYYDTVGGNSAAVNTALFEKACVDADMDAFYDSLSSQGVLRRDFSCSACLENAVVSGAGMVLSSEYCRNHPPFLVFGKYQNVNSSSQELDHDVMQLAAGRAERFDGPADGELFPNVMWIDDEITAEYLKLHPMCRSGSPYPAVPYPETDGAVFASKKRSAPGNPLWYTLAIYMPTLYSGFVVMSVVKGCRDADACFSDFQKLMPSGSIGELWCKTFAKGGGVEKSGKMLAQVDSVLQEHEKLQVIWQKLMHNEPWVTKTVERLKKRFSLDRAAMDACGGDLTSLKL